MGDRRLRWSPSLIEASATLLRDLADARSDVVTSNAILELVASLAGCL